MTATDLLTSSSSAHVIGQRKLRGTSWPPGSAPPSGGAARSPVASSSANSASERATTRYIGVSRVKRSTVTPSGEEAREEREEIRTTLASVTTERGD